MPKQTVVTNVNDAHRESLTLQERFALKITHAVGTMFCVYVFAGIGVGSLVGVLTGNIFLATLFGAFSSYFLQLVFLPLLQLGQNLQARHAELRAEEDYANNIRTEKNTQKIIRMLQELKNRPIG